MEKLQASVNERVYNKTMKIGLISDTHISELKTGVDFLDALCGSVFADVDYILHAGDIVNPDLLYYFTEKPLIAVGGNCDEAHPELPEKRILEFMGVRIGLIHGWGGPSGIVKNVLSRFEGEAIDVLVFGHSHYPLCQQNNGLMLFNPGSATDRRNAPFHSVGILELGDMVKGKVVNIDSYVDPWIDLNGVCT